MKMKFVLDASLELLDVNLCQRAAAHGKEEGIGMSLRLFGGEPSHLESANIGMRIEEDGIQTKCSFNVPYSICEDIIERVS